MRRFAGFVLVIAVAMSACSPDEPTARPRPTPLPSATPTPPAPPSPTPGAAAVGRCGAPTYPEPDPNRPKYDLDVRMNGGPVVRGTTEVDFTPDIPTGRLIFRLWPNAPVQGSRGAHLFTGEVTIDGRRTREVQPNPTTLVVALDDRLTRGQEVTARVPWRLRLPGPVLDRISLDGQSYRLGSFFPILPWVPGEGWALDPPTTSFAEANVSPVADFEVTVKVPEGYSVLASGKETSPGRWRAEAVRDFALAAGPFDIARATAKTPERVAVRVGVDRNLGTAPDAWVQQVVADIEEMAKRFGPYPWTTFNLAIMPSLSSAGIEYPTMVFQGPETLGQTTSHELGHMWFYSLVGSNPARDPWLDEGLASWAEASVEDSLGEFMSYQLPSGTAGEMGRPMTYWDGFTGRDYYLGVYAQGVQALGSLGRPAEVSCGLRAYVAAHAYGITQPDDLLDSLDDIIPRARRVLTRFGARF